MLLDPENVKYYIVSACVVLVASYFANKWKETMESDGDEYKMIQKYLLNDSPLYGYNRPKLWIHTKYEINARKWKDFYSRNSTDLNEPYIHLCIKSIIDHCGDDFNICLIDDQTFSKLIPSWDVEITHLAEPMRTHFRELAMLLLIYYYGGMTLPNSFVCMKNMATFYHRGIAGGRPFVCENANRTTNLFRQRHKMLFLPDLSIFGAEKNDPVLLELVQYLKLRNRNPHFSGEVDFLGDTKEWCLNAVNKMQMNLMGGELVGVKTSDRKTILLEDLMETQELNFHPDIFGIYIPNDELLIRPKYQWFSVLSREDVLKTDAIVAKHLLESIIESNDEYKKRSVIQGLDDARGRTVVAL
jgi:hypothetical protein